MGLVFIASWTAQLIAGRSTYNVQQLRGSPESKPVGAPHSATGIEG